MLNRIVKYNEAMARFDEISKNPVLRDKQNAAINTHAEEVRSAQLEYDEEIRTAKLTHNKDTDPNFLSEAYRSKSDSAAKVLANKIKIADDKLRKTIDEI